MLFLTGVWPSESAGGSGARHGVQSMHEAGLAIIQNQLRNGGTALSWADPAQFAELMLS